LLYRSRKTNCKGLKPDFTEKQYANFLRPGAKEFLYRMLNHDRIRFGLYSSMMRKNVIPIAFHLLDESYPELFELAKIKGHLIFDQDHCAKMHEHASYKRLAENEWDTFRDLHRVF
jgi:hypothetical protein